jgi:myo-inositol-1(or 4)-monophosphatase
VDETFVAVAAEAALRAGAIQKMRLGDEIEVHHKGEIDLVTDVDHACEQAVIDVLRSRFPDHDIVTEESDLERTGSRHVWYVDPLDGTTNYAHGYPFFCCSVALVVDGEAVAGAVFDPVHQELFTGERGGGAYLNGRRLSVSSTSELVQSLVVVGFPYDVRDRLPGCLESLGRLMARAQAVRRDGSAALDLCYVGAGRLEGFSEDHLQAWDFLAGALIVEEAGGRVTRHDGSTLTPAAGQILASNGVIHDELRHLVVPPSR